VRSAPDAFTYSELDEILRGSGHAGAVGMSAIDGLIAALVAAPSFVHPEEWMPLVFAGRQPVLDPSGPEGRAVQTILNRYNEVSTILADQPGAYRPLFMVDDSGMIVAQDWATGFMLGVALRPEDWGKRILLTEYRQLLIPILVSCDPALDLLPEMSPAEKRRRQATAPAQIAGAVIAVRAICNPHRAAEGRRERPQTRRSTPTRR
jgi:yecA family protein